MAQLSTRYTVDVRLNPDDFPVSDKSVIWDASSGSFELGEGSSAIEVGPLIAPPDTESYYGTFSPTNDSTPTTLSGSDFQYVGVASSAPLQAEFRFLSSSESTALISYVPIGIQEESGVTDPIRTYEFIRHIDVTQASAGMVNLTKIQVPPQFYTNTLEGFNAIKIEHVVYSTADRASQYITTTMVWAKDSGGTLTGLTATAVENAKAPFNKAIIDPKSVTGSFDANDALVYQVYHYIATATHKIKYTLI